MFTREDKKSGNQTRGPLPEEPVKKILHDLQSPLTVIQGFFRLIEDEMAGGHFSADQQELFRAARESLQKVIKLLSNPEI